jgi:NAD(P)H-hydrate epimerase
MSGNQPTITHSLSREQVRQVDKLAIQEYAMSGLVLMENAGRGVAEFACRLSKPVPAGILCGKGNNAGDGYVIARHLQLAGWPVRIIQLYDPGDLRGDAAANWTIAQRAEIDTVVLEADQLQRLPELLADCGMLFDCLLGTGASGAPRSPLAEAIVAANATAAVKIAVDLPSGLDCDTGEVHTPCLRADYTCTFVATKPGFDTAGGRQVTGTVEVIGIGVPRKLLSQM